MKILIFGIDGLGKDSLEKLGLSKLAKRMERGIVSNPKIHNIISRGWPEVYTGKNAFQIGTFYQSPELKNGSICPTNKTGLNYVKCKFKDEYLLWNRLNDYGYKVGLFTIPTISEPEQVNGFCVAATGAGRINNRLSEQDFYPKEIVRELDISNVDLGLRMGYGAYLPDSIQDLETTTNKHIVDYFDLLNKLVDKMPVDVCFAASRFVNEMATKFIGLLNDNPKNSFDIKLKKAVLGLCSNFDSQLDCFINKVKPQHLFVVSDHGLGRLNYELNLNQFLYEANLIKKSPKFSNWKDILRPLYYYSKRKIFRKKIGVILPKYNLDNSSFFSIGFTNVIYLNDDRFSGKSYSNSDREKYLISTIKELNIKAKNDGVENLIRFEQNYVKSSLFPSPDIVCKIATGITNSERRKHTLCQQEFMFEKFFKEGFYGEYSGCKTEDTIASYLGDNSDMINFKNLTNVYDSILKIAESEKK